MSRSGAVMSGYDTGLYALRQQPRSKGDWSVPIEDYQHMIVDEVVIELDHLPQHELREIRRYEAVHKARKTLLQQIDRRLRDVGRNSQ